jgi:hypothetical protein
MAPNGDAIDTCNMGTLMMMCNGKGDPLAPHPTAARGNQAVDHPLRRGDRCASPAGGGSSEPSDGFPRRPSARRAARLACAMAISDRHPPRRPPLDQQHGDQATARARDMVEAMRRTGDDGGADTWLRIIVAIGTLNTPATEARQ